MIPRASPRALPRRIVFRLFGVHHLDDAFERIARWGPAAGLLRGLLRTRLNAAVLGSQVLFIHVPKNAGTSIATAIYGWPPAHKTAHFYRTAAPIHFGRAVVFAVLRDPVERFVSAYWFIRNRGGDDVQLSPTVSKDMGAIDTPEALLDYLESNIANIYRLDHVLRPQWWYLIGSDGRILTPNLFILGEGAERLDAFLAAHGVKSVPVMNRTSKGALQLTAAQVDRVRAVYKRDLALIERVRQGGGHGPV